MDEVIDESGIQLIAVIPECSSLAAAIQKGTAYDGKSKAAAALANLAARVTGESVPLLIS